MHADVIIEVPFHDVDTMHVVWHGHYLKSVSYTHLRAHET